MTENETYLLELTKTDLGQFMTELLDLLGIGNAEIGDYETDGALAQGEGFSIELLDSYTGYEGGGESCYAVVKVMHLEDEIAIMRLNGIYNSFEGTEWYNDWKQVVPLTFAETSYYSPDQVTDELIKSSRDSILNAAALLK